MGVEVLDDGTVIIKPDDDATMSDVSRETVEEIESVSRETLETANEALETAEASEASTKELLELCRTQSQQIQALIQQQTVLSNDLASIQAQLLQNQTTDTQTPSDTIAEENLETESQDLENMAEEPTLILTETDTSEISTEPSSSTETEVQDVSVEDQKDTASMEALAPVKHRVMMY